LIYVSVADLEASIATSTSLGGEVVVPPMPVPTVGRIAVVKDPQGAVIGLHQRA
jgi:predicted enzyme related to lactoylglutathione lyase